MSDAETVRVSIRVPVKVHVALMKAGREMNGFDGVQVAQLLVTEVSVAEVLERFKAAFGPPVVVADVIDLRDDREVG